MSRPLIPLRATALAVSLSALFALGPAIAQQQADPHAAAIEMARGGDHAGALAELERLAAQRPDDRAILFDQIVVLGWANRHADALARASGVDLAGAPAYVLEGIGYSARSLQRFELARDVYRRAVAAYPDRVAARLGLALTLAELGDPAGAAKVLDEALANSPNDPGLLDARAVAAEAAGDWPAALSFHQKALQAAPQRRDSLRGVVRVAARLGAPQLAADIAARHPGLLGEAEMAALADDASALQIRWGRIEERIESGDARFAWLDRALQRSEPAARQLAALVAAAPEGEPVDGSAIGPPERRLLADRLVALALRHRHEEAVALYRSMTAAKLPVPTFARKSAADSLLESRQPDEAASLYREVLAAQPEDFDAATGLFFALVESERIDEATAYADALVERTPKWLPSGRANPDAVTARTGQALARLYGDRLDEAELRTGGLLAELPYNAQVREAFAATAQARGWPRLADEEYRRALAVDPGSAGLRAERVAPLLDVHAWAEAQAQLAEAAALRPDDHRVRRARDLWTVHNLREIEASTVYGVSSGDTPTGTEDWRLDARLYTRPLAQRWRLFAQTTQARANFDTGVTRWHREGIGAEYRARDIRLTAAATGGSADKAGLEAAGAWQIDDHWSVGVFGSSVTSNVPLQAWDAGVRASELGIGGRYAAHESRNFAAGVSQLAFSDGNDRNGLWGSWFERWVSTPRWRLETAAWLGASNNSLAGAPYFNPGSDTTASVEVAGEWLSWRHYERQFRQRLAATIGSYAQEGYGSGRVLGGIYEHVWELDRRLYLRYGIGRTLRPYDGLQSGRTFGQIILDGRF